MLDALAARGVEIARVTLHVGLGTFAPLRVERVDEVPPASRALHAPESAADAINRAVREGRRIVAVGTTVVRTLEHCALQAAGRESSRTPARRRSSSRPASSSAWWARCSPTFICRNRAC
jgi:S-adenosylmethionine:tRNA-ribosyltransferase-isomerase (queuine synthetase)